MLVASLSNGRCDPEHPSASGSFDGEAESLGLIAPRMKAGVALTQDTGKHSSRNDPSVVRYLLKLTMAKESDGAAKAIGRNLALPTIVLATGLATKKGWMREPFKRYEPTVEG